jgi:prevent-host-death family protein
MPKTRLTATDARKTFSETLLRVFKGERIVLQRHGRDLAALIPMEDCTWLEELEDLVDLAAARTALAEGGRAVAYERLRKELGLKARDVPSAHRSGRGKTARIAPAKATRAGRRASAGAGGGSAPRRDKSP